MTGTSSILRQPERAFLTLCVSSHGPSQETVSKETTSRSNHIQQHLKQLAPKTETGAPTSDASVTAFSVGFLRSWSRIPFTGGNEPRPRVYHAEVKISANFRNYTTLSEFTATLLCLSNIEILGIDWQLTAPTKKSLGSESRKLAMLDAVEKARDYAEVIGREVVAVEVKEPSSWEFGYGRPAAMLPQMPQMPGGSAGGGAEKGLDLTPQNIELKHTLQVKFRGD